MKLEERNKYSKRKEDDMDVGEPYGNAANVQQYFAKYLTSPRLLELQLGDSKFRQYILNQFLIIFQYLNAPVKSKQFVFFSLNFFGRCECYLIVINCVGILKS